MEAAGGRPYIIVPKNLLSQLKGIPGGINIVVRKIISSYRLVANYDPRTDNLAIIGQNEDILQLAIHSLRLWVDKERAKKIKFLKSTQVPSEKDDIEWADIEYNCYLNNLKVNWAFYGDFAKKVSHLLAPELEELKNIDNSILIRPIPSAEKLSELEIGCAFEVYPQIKVKVESIIEKARRLYKDDNFFIPKSDEVKANAFIEKKKDNKDVLYILTEEYEPEPRIRMTVYGRSGGHVATARLDWIEVAGPGLPGSNLVEGYLSGKNNMDKGTKSSSQLYSYRAVDKTAKLKNSSLSSGRRNSGDLRVHFEKTRIAQGTKDNIKNTIPDGQTTEKKRDTLKENATADGKTKNNMKNTIPDGQTTEKRSDALKENATADGKSKNNMKNTIPDGQTTEKKRDTLKKENATADGKTKNNVKNTIPDGQTTEKKSDALMDNATADGKTKNNMKNIIPDGQKKEKKSDTLKQENATADGKTKKNVKNTIPDGQTTEKKRDTLKENAVADGKTENNMKNTIPDGQTTEKKSDALKDNATADGKTKNNMKSTIPDGQTTETKSDALKENATADGKTKNNMKNTIPDIQTTEKKSDAFKKENATADGKRKNNIKNTATDGKSTEKKSDALKENATADGKTEKKKNNLKESTITDGKGTEKKSFDGTLQETRMKRNDKTNKIEGSFNKQKPATPESDKEGSQKGQSGSKKDLHERKLTEAQNGIERVTKNERKKKLVAKTDQNTGQDNTIKSKQVTISGHEKSGGKTVKVITESRPISMDSFRTKFQKKRGSHTIENSETKSNPEIEFTSKGSEKHIKERKQLLQSKIAFNDFKGRFEMRSDAQDSDYLYKRTFDTIYKYKDFKYYPYERTRTKQEKSEQNKDVGKSTKNTSFLVERQRKNSPGMRARGRYSINLDEVGDFTTAQLQEKSESDTVDSQKNKKKFQSKESDKENLKSKESAEANQEDKGNENNDNVSSSSGKAAQGPKGEKSGDKGGTSKKKSTEKRTIVSKGTEEKTGAKQNTRKKYDPWQVKKEKDQVEQKKLEPIVSQPKREDKFETGIQLKITEALERQQEWMSSHQEVKPRQVLKLTGRKNEEIGVNGNLFSNAPPCNEYLDSQFRYSFVRNGLRVFIYQFFIIEHRSVDLIVNDTDERLRHYNGIAAQIAKAAGKQLEQDCRVFCTTVGSINVTENCITTAGKLKCEGVLHAVGPEWGSYEKKEECLRDLYYTILNVLKEAETHKYRRVAMTPLSAGTYRVPSDLCADMHIKALMVYAERRSSPTIHEVHIVDTRTQMLNLLKGAHKKWLQDPESLNFDKAKAFNLFPDVETVTSRSSSVTLDFKDNNDKRM